VVDGRSDLYSLGGVGFYALTGRAPFEATTLEALSRRPPHAHGATRRVGTVPTRRPRSRRRSTAAFARDPHERYASAEAVAEVALEATGVAGTQTSLSRCAASSVPLSRRYGSPLW